MIVEFSDGSRIGLQAVDGRFTLILPVAADQVWAIVAVTPEYAVTNGFSGEPPWGPAGPSSQTIRRSSTSARSRFGGGLPLGAFLRGFW